MPRRALAILAALVAGAAGAQQVPTERLVLGDARITIHLHPFLTDEGRDLLRLVGENPDALALFRPSGTGHAALALAPGDGLLRDGVQAPSAKAVADLPDPESARVAARDACDAARSGGPACVIALEVAPR